MLDPKDFREIVSGRRLGTPAASWRTFFAAIEPFYAAAVRYRNKRYDRGRAEIVRVDVPVISVGNLTLGGTGKTPMVEWLARWFAANNVPVALVSRGYGARSGQANDEAKELAEKLPDVPHILDRRRARGAQTAVDKHGAQLILLDDGFQHRSLARDLDIVLVDALEPFGFEHVFPRGTLREPLSGFARADVIALSRADAVDSATREQIHDRIRSFNRDALWLELAHTPQSLRSADGRHRPLEDLQGKRLLAFCGIGNPAGFRQSLASCGYEIVEFREFADHYAYSVKDVEDLSTLAERVKADAIVCTHKDLVKITPPHANGLPLWALEIGLSISTGRDALESRLRLLVNQALRASK